MADQDAVRGWQSIPGKDLEAGVGQLIDTPRAGADTRAYEDSVRSIYADIEDVRKRLYDVEDSYGDINAHVYITQNLTKQVQESVAKIQTIKEIGLSLRRKVDSLSQEDDSAAGQRRIGLHASLESILSLLCKDFTRYIEKMY